MAKFVGILDLPFHWWNITQKELLVKRGCKLLPMPAIGSLESAYQGHKSKKARGCNHLAFSDAF
jgi:hypothetical protein